MRLLRFVKRAVLVITSSAAMLVAGLSVYLRIEQYRFRGQAERLLSDVRELELNKASAAEVRLVAKKWGFKEWQGSPCTENDCAYHFQLMSPDPRRLLERWAYAHWDTIALTLLGARPIAVKSSVQIRGQEFRSAWLSVSTFGCGEDWGDCTLTAVAGTKEESSFSAYDQADVKLKHSLLHPG